MNELKLSLWVNLSRETSSLRPISLPRTNVETEA